MKPRIDRTNLDMKRCKVGDTLLIDVNVTGEPTPTTAWSILGQEITTKDNFTVENIEYNTKLKIENGTRKNTQKFKITATNENGSDEAFVEVVFLGKPSAPLGPLEVYGATKNSCKLNWRAPEDDGGLPIKKYIVEFQDKATGKWEPLCETPGDVTNCVAKPLEEGHEYLFRVKAVNDEGESEPLVADKYIKAKDPFGEKLCQNQHVIHPLFLCMENCSLMEFLGIFYSSFPFPHHLYHHINYNTFSLNFSVYVLLFPNKLF